MLTLLDNSRNAIESEGYYAKSDDCAAGGIHDSGFNATDWAMACLT